ncbi:MAG: hypothetical protein R3F62_04035 [Planctomycetota bacterium]
MLALLRALERPAPGAPDLGLSPADQAVVHELYQKLESDVARPFFRVDDLAQVDAHWGAWIDWFRPHVQALHARLLPLLTDPARREAVLAGLKQGWGESLSAVEQVSDALALTLRESLRSGLAADRELLARGPALGGRVTPERWQRREYASIGFGLAFLLLLETLERAPEDAARVRFLVLKLKRMAAVSWSATRALLAELGAP